MLNKEKAMKLTTGDVAQYLKEHPKFFEEHVSLLEEAFIPHPHGGRAISLAERQQLALREKNKLLEAKLRELLQFGEENDAIGEKVHRFSLAIINSHSLDSLLPAIYLTLREDFAVPDVALRIWTLPAQETNRPEFSGTSKELRVFAENLTTPYCGPHAPYEAGAWFGEDKAHLKSYAIVALRAEQAFGLLVLASGDAHRFYPEMGTLYLKRLGELVSVAMQPYLSHDKDAA